MNEKPSHSEMPTSGKAELSPERRELLRRLIESKGLDPSRLPITKASRNRDDLPLSFAQERLWLVHQLDPASPAYNIGFTVRVAAPLCVAALRQALNEIVRRHEVLRTSFPARDGRPRQCIAPPVDVTLPVVDLRGLPEPNRDVTLQQQIEQDSLRPFDLNRGPVFRARLLRLGQTEYVLVLTMHHIVVDAWSQGRLFYELNLLYEAFVKAEPSPLLELPIQYADYAVWQHQTMQGEVLRSHVAYWKQQLADLETLQLPTDRPHPPVPSHHGQRATRMLSEDLSHDLMALGQREGVTPFMTLLAALNVLLFRYSGQSDIVVGSPVAGRDRAETEPLIGFFVNMLVLRTEVSRDSPFRQLLSRVRTMALDAYKHQDVPFEKLVSELEPERDLSRHPLFQVTFDLQNAPAGDAGPAAPALRPSKIENRTTRFDLEVCARVTAKGIAIECGYRECLFDAPTIDRMLEHYQVLLEGIVADPDQHVSRLPLMTAREQRQVLVQWNQTATDDTRDATIDRRFEQQVGRTPNSAAVVCGEQELSYLQLNARANQVARALKRCGVGPEVMVGICVERSVEMVVGLLGILKAGGAYVPLDPTCPRQRLAFMVEDTNAPVLLTQRRLLSRLPGRGRKVICLDQDERWWKDASHENLPPETGAGSLAYVIYTSGSSGRPKGVAVEHRGLVNLVTWHVREYQLTSADRATLIASPAFDASVWELWPYLAAGASVHIPHATIRSSPRRLVEWLTGQRITFCFLPTPLAEAVMDLPWAPDVSLKALLTGGDKLHCGPPPSLPFPVMNHYGPTENSVVTTWCAVAPATEAAGPPPIGRPISNVEVYVLDHDMNPLPIGVPGELCIGGLGLARGYWNRPQLTADRFVPHPFRRDPGARLYRTGDRVRYRPDGMIDFLGRMDQQVKVRGFRVEPGEIESILSRHEGVNDAAVLCREDERGQKRLVAYLVVANGYALSNTELRAYTRRSLPDYMVPSAFVPLKELPLTPNGKVDYRVLRALPGGDPSESNDTGAAPRTPVEEQLAEIWCDILNLRRVGVHDSFFELGGHSLLAAQFISRVLQTFGVEIPLARLFQRPTVADLAQEIEAARHDGLPPLRPALVPATDQAEAAASFAQERLWFMEQLVPNSPFYNIPLALRLRGALNRDALQQTLDEIVRRHAVLRTTFRPGVSGLSQAIGDFQPTEVAFQDLTAVPEADREAEARRLASDETNRPFDLARGPVLRVHLLELAAEDHVLLIVMHHMVSDGWSLGVLFEELKTLYTAFTAGEPSPLPPLGIQYADFAVWQRQWLQGEVLSEQVRYWKEKLARVSALELPTDRARPAVQTFRGARAARAMPGALRKELQTLSEKEGVTLFMTVLAAFQVLMHRYTGQDDIVVGSPVANRNRAELEGLIGFFVNNLVMRTDVSGNPCFRDVLKRVREVALDAFAHQDLPFERLVEELRPQRDLSRNPLFQVAFALQKAPNRLRDLGDVALSLMPLDCHTTRFDLEIHVWDDGESLRISCVYSTDLFDASTIQRMLGHYQTLLEGAVSNPDLPLSQLPLMTAGERHRVVVQFNETATDYPRSATIHQLFEQQVARAPESIALQWDGQTLTYGQLNARANQLAHHLRRLGVGPEVMVGICVQRSFEMVVGILGILKAGGAYVPLDPDYPESRLQFMIADARAPVLLTQDHLSARLSQHRGKTVCLDRDWPDIAREEETGFDGGAKAVNLAYVIYTSGSTGRPKGTSVAHRSVVRLVKATNYATFGADEVFLQFAPLSFDASTFELWGSLLNGSKLVVFPPHTPSPDELARFIQANGVTTLWLTAALFHQMVDEHLECLGRVRQLLAGGDTLAVDRAEKVIASLGDRRLVNGYGPTENTTFSCCHVMTSASRLGRSVPIGRPISNSQVFILDREMRPVPIGVPGQLYLGGDGLARGYLNMPELTKEAFVASPFSADKADRLYRTGDRGRYLADGTIEFLGRMDYQVKIRGFRIEPAEIEAWLTRHADIKAAVVITHEHDTGDRQLVAYVVARNDPPPSTSRLRRFLGEELPAYMVPNRFVFLDSLPTSPNGKLDRDRLPSPTGRRPDIEAAFVPPTTELERVVADIWREVLGIDTVGLRDNFFDLGGHSLRLVTVRGRLKETIGQELSMVDMFKYPTVSGLAERLSRGVGKATAGPDDACRDPRHATRTRLAQLEQLRKKRGGS